MRNLLFSFTAYLYKLRFILCKNINLKGHIFALDLKAKSSNRIDIKKELSHSSIKINGNNNTIYSNGIVQHTNIKIIGNNNRITLKNNCRFCNSELLIRADNAEFILGERSNILEGYFICQGTNNYIHIGNDCLFAHNVEIWNSDTHIITDLEGEIINKSKPIKIGNHVWLGKYVKVLKGVTIGDNSVVGMNSMVTRDIPANTINAGIPSRTVRNDINWNKELITI